jgi:1-deoxy-D-xylulose-5-phosphate reductoisomerase
MIENICLLGATGSIGDQTLAVMALHPDRYQLLAFSAYQNVEKSISIIRQFSPKYVAMVDLKAASELTARVREQGYSVEVLAGELSLNTLVEIPEVTTVVASIVGAAGLPSTFRAAQLGKKILLANKEALVMTGSLLMNEVANNKGLILPIDR